MVSVENTKFTTEFKETKIQWKLVKYPDNLIKDNMSKLTKDKKRFNYRNKAKNYTIEDNILFFTGFKSKQNCKLRIPFLNKKQSILDSQHSKNGHLGINRTVTKIKEMGFFWNSMIEDVKSFIDNCSA